MSETRKQVESVIDGLFAKAATRIAVIIGLPVAGWLFSQMWADVKDVKLSQHKQEIAVSGIVKDVESLGEKQKHHERRILRLEWTRSGVNPGATHTMDSN
jgi:hypothetical protein